MRRTSKTLRQSISLRLDDDTIAPIAAFMEQMGCETQTEGLRMLIRVGLGGQYDALALLQGRTEGLRQGRQWFLKRCLIFLGDLRKELDAMERER